jgi:branched-chain amino acid transport system permease protein
VATATSAPRDNALGRLGRDPIGWGLTNAHWLAGLLLLVFIVAWMELGFGGSYSSNSRQQVYLIDVLLLYMLVAMGLNILSGYVGAASIGHIALFAIGAYTEAILTTDHNWHVWPAIFAGGFVAMAAALPVGLILLRLSGWYFSVVTLLLVIVVADLILQQQGLTGGGAGIFGLTTPFIGSRQLDIRDYVYLISGINVLVFLMLRHLYDASRWGKAFQAVREAEPAARAVGIHPFMVQESALAMSGFLAGFAGALFAPLPGIVNPDSFPILDSIFFLLAILAGGMGTVPGPVVGTLVLYIVPQWVNRQDSIKDWSFLIYGILLLGFVMFLPEGIVGGATRIWRRLFGAQMARAKAANPMSWPGAGDVPGLALGYLGAPAAPDARPAVLEVRDIEKAFGGFKALDGVSITVRQGTIHAIVGPNGSGKTSLLNVISGFYRQEGGSVVVDGHEVRRGRAAASIRHGIARTFQTPQVLQRHTGLANVELGCHTNGRSTIVEGLLPLPNVRREARLFTERSKACIALVGLGVAQAEAPCSTLPFAHRRLLEIARAVAGKPRVLLLDEPASGLHPDEVRDFARLLRELRAAGLTIVLVEHNFGLVGELADTITVMDAGRVLAEGDFEAVRTNPQVVEAYLGA